MLGGMRSAVMAAIASAFAGRLSLPGGRKNSSRNRNRNRRRNVLRHDYGYGYAMIDGILHKQSDNPHMANLRGYPGAKMARKAAQGKIGKRA